MNIFYLDRDPAKAAQDHCDKHCVKMILEYAQLLSTAHRVLDGQQIITKNKNGGKLTTWIFKDRELENKYYRPCHVKHPSNIWVRDSLQNYHWLYKLFLALGQEFEKRYNKKHLSILKLKDALNTPPMNISFNNEFTEPTPAMPEYCKIPNDSLASYRKYYIKEKHFAEWKYSETPQWYLKGKEEEQKSELSFYEALV
tara:strand:- start:137157 stop:137750 length:594 start_codon:yes stop_codon:yes gene_type:complete